MFNLQQDLIIPSREERNQHGRREFVSCWALLPVNWNELVPGARECW